MAEKNEAILWLYCYKSDGYSVIPAGRNLVDSLSCQGSKKVANLQIAAGRSSRETTSQLTAELQKIHKEEQRIFLCLSSSSQKLRLGESKHTKKEKKKQPK